MALEDCGISVASEITKDLLYSVKRQARYFFCFDNNAKNLGTEKERLVSKQHDLLKRAEDAKNNTGRITREVENWLKKAEEHIGDADGLEEEAKIKRNCFLGWCPNCIWQYRLGRQIVKKTQEVAELHANSEFKSFSRLSTLPGMGYYSSKDYVDFQSRKWAYDELLEAVKDSKNFRVGLYGMGGLGKTTLVKEVGKEVEKSKAFDKVVFVVVSNPPDVGKIQDNIADVLRLKFEEQDESNRAKRLYKRLTDGEKILLILDDVWCKLNFEAVGIPFDSHQGSCRVLLTTRSADICCSMNCQLEINLSELSEDEAWILFNKHAKIDEMDPKLVVAKEIARQCKRLPVAIAAVASTLKNQDLEFWEEALSTLKDSKPIDNIDEDLAEIYRCLKLSYDNLKNERAKKLFLLCSLFPEDYEIPMEDLIRYGIGLGIFGDEDSYGTLRIQTRNAKNKLIDACMLLNAASKRESVKMHDLVRDVAHWIANKEIQVVLKLKRNLKAELEDIRSKGLVKWLWLHINMIHETPDLLNSTKLNILDPLNWPELKILIVTVDVARYFVDVSDILFKGMESLQVLTLIGFGPMVTTMPIPELINLQTLRLQNWILGDISVIGNLKRLKTLELEDCRITELPDRILELKKLRVLGLLCCSVQKNPFGVMGRFFQLEELYFTKSHEAFQWKVDGECISEFFDGKCCLGKLKRYYIEIGDGQSLYGSMNCLEPSGLYIQSFDPSTSNEIIKDLVQRAEILHLKNVQGGYKSITPDVVQAVGGLNELIRLELDSCLEIESLLDTTNHSSEMGIIFSNLDHLSLRTMHSLKELCHGPAPSDCFQKLGTLSLYNCSKLQNILCVGNLNICNLKAMSVIDCPALTSLFTLSIALSLKLLQTLRIRNCSALKYIIADQITRENENIIVQENDERDQKLSDGSMFPKLKYICINRCNSLEWIFPLSFAGDLEQLEDMTVDRASELKTIFGQYQHEDQPLHEKDREIILPSLRIMELSKIPKFLSIFPIYDQPSYQPLQSTNLESTASMELHKLKYKNSERLLPLATEQCLSKELSNLCHLRKIALSSIPKIVSLFKVSTAQDMLLEHLKIIECPELRNIIANEEEDHDGKNYESVTVFPKLRSVEVRNCNLLTMVFPVTMAHGLVQLESITLIEAPQLVYVFGHDDHLSHQIENNIQFPALTDLELRELPKMVSICSNNYYPTWPILNSLWLSKCPLLKTSSIIDCITKKESRESVVEGNHSRVEVQALENMLNLGTLDIEDDGELEGIFLLDGLPNSWQQTQLSSKLEDLTLKDLPKLRHICKTPLVLSFRHLESLTVHGCGKLSFVFSACVLTNLPQLEDLSIRDCDQLEQIMEDEEDHKLCFPSLSGIEIQRCNKLKYLFSINKCNKFPELWGLKIKESSQIEEVFRHKVCNAEDKLMLPSLSHLELVKLPSLVSICRGFELQSVKHVILEDCPKLPSTLTTTVEAFPHEYQNAEKEKGKETKEEVEEEIKGEEQVAVKDGKAVVPNRGTDESREDKGKQPAKTVLTSNEGKDPQTPTSHSEEEEEREVKMAVVQTTTAIMDENSDLAEVNNAMHHDKMKGPSEIVLTTLISDDDHPALVESSSLVPAQSIQISSPNVVPHNSSNTLLPSVSLPPPFDLPPEFDPSCFSMEQLRMASAEEYAKFRDIGSIKKKHIPLLEKIIVKHPSLWTWHERFKRIKMKRLGYVILGDMLEFLASTRWRDLNEEKKAEFDSLLSELETFGFDVQWLGDTRAMIEQGKLDEKTINRIKTLEAQVMEQEIEVQMAKEKLQKTKLELNAARAELEKLDDFIGF